MKKTFLLIFACMSITQYQTHLFSSEKASSNRSELEKTICPLTLEEFIDSRFMYPEISDYSINADKNTAYDIKKKPTSLIDDELKDASQFIIDLENSISQMRLHRGYSFHENKQQLIALFDEKKYLKSRETLKNFRKNNSSTSDSKA